jgi:hypothetical protein
MLLLAALALSVHGETSLHGRIKNDETGSGPICIEMGLFEAETTPKQVTSNALPRDPTTGCKHRKAKCIWKASSNTDRGEPYLPHCAIGRGSGTTVEATSKGRPPNVTECSDSEPAGAVTTIKTFYAT